MHLKLFLLSVKFLKTVSHCVWLVAISICSLVETFKCIVWETLVNNSGWLNTLLCFKNFMWKLAEISAYVNYSIDALYGFALPRYILPICLEKLNSRDCHSYFLNFISSRFPHHSLLFLLVYLRVFDGTSTVPLGVSPISLQCSSFLPFRIEEMWKSRLKCGLNGFSVTPCDILKMESKQWIKRKTKT